MDTDFEQQYQAAERAYGLGNYSEAEVLTTGLWEQLETPSNDQDRNLVLGWRAVVSLLLGHIQLHGLHQPDEAASAYQRVLDSEPEATLVALAEQGLERCRSENTASEAKPPRTADGSIPDLLKDPFLSTDPDQAKPAQADVVTAMPWLAQDEEPQAVSTPAATPTATPTPTPTPAPTATPTPVPSPEPTVAPEADSAVDLSTPEQEQPSTEQPPPEQPSSDDVDPTPPDTADKDLLETSWLRVQLKPEPSSPTDSNKPMGLINRIKRALTRSAGH